MACLAFVRASHSQLDFFATHNMDTRQPNVSFSSLATAANLSLLMKKILSFPLLHSYREHGTRPWGNCNRYTLQGWNVVGTGYWYYSWPAITSLPSLTGSKQHVLLWLPPNWNIHNPLLECLICGVPGKTGCYSDHPNQEQTIPGTTDDYQQSWVTTLVTVVSTSLWEWPHMYWQSH